MSKLMDFIPFAVKNLFSRPATSKYPFEPREYPQRSRGHIEVVIDECIFCGSCQRKCPSDAITVDRSKHMWSINRMGCVQCGYCVDNCPKNCLNILPGYTSPTLSKTVDEYIKQVEETPARGKLKNDMGKCVFCTLCAKKCPAGAITVDRNEKKWDCDDDKCTKCGLCAESCPKKSLSFEEASVQSSESPEIVNDTDKCVFCTLCAKKCPQEAITVDRNEKKWAFDKTKCVGCGLCVESCPKKSLSMK